jgi:hypothetical protein
MTDAQLTEPVKQYLRKVVELRRAFEAYQGVQAEIDVAWHQLPERTKEWLAHMDHHDFRALKEAALADG